MRFKNNTILLGFLISFIGYIPLGYLNIVGLQILSERGQWSLFFFVIGVIFVEFFVLNMVSLATKWFVNQNKLWIIIEVFSVVFFLSIAGYFFTNNSNEHNLNLSQLYFAKYPFFLGVLLNGLNTLQWPYWSGIYMYVYKTNKLDSTKKANSLFIFGALLGSAAGILSFVELSHYILVKNHLSITQNLNSALAFVFFVLATFKIVKLLRRKVKKVKELSTSINYLKLKK